MDDLFVYKRYNILNIRHIYIFNLRRLSTVIIYFYLYTDTAKPPFNPLIFCVSR